MDRTIAGTLRIVAGLTVLFSLIVAGYLSRSPWIVVLATPVLTLLYALGKFPAWRSAWHVGDVKTMIVGVLTTLPVQLILGGMFYFIGLGMARLLAPAPITPLGWTDVIAVGVVFVICLACSIVIIRLEGDTSAGQMGGGAQPVPDSVAGAYAGEDLELDIDPTPLARETFFRSPGYWRPDPAREALEGRGKRVAKPVLAASDEDIAAVEERIGFRLPESLRALYRILDGGYVGDLYVPLKAEPAPVFDDWCGAFSIDYSSLVPLENLRTVADHYDDFTHDPEDVPENASRLVILQARYGDMTLLDYSKPGEPRVLIVDFDRNGDLTDIEFETFDAFFQALRRPKDETPRPFNRELYRSKPLGTLPEDSRAAAFWNGNNHPFVNLAKGRGDGWMPKEMADDALIAETESRIGAKLPDAIKELWKARNGGEVLYRWLDDGPDKEIMAFEELAPLEYAATLAELSQRIDFPPGEPPWHQKIAGADKLIVLNAKRDELVLLDYRGDELQLLLVDDFEASGIDNARSFKDFGALIGKLRKFERSPLLPGIQ